MRVSGLAEVSENALVMQTSKDYTKGLDLFDTHCSLVRYWGQFRVGNPIQRPASAGRNEPRAIFLPIFPYSHI